MKLTGTLIMTWFLVMTMFQNSEANSASDNCMDSDIIPASAETYSVDYELKSDFKFTSPPSRFVPSYISNSNYGLNSDESELVGEDVTVGLQGGKYGVGFAASFPAFGVSGTYQISETLTAEAILGIFGVISNYSLRGWYRFNRNQKYDIYGYGGLSILQYRYRTFTNNRRNTESVPGVGVGAGIEYGIQELFNDHDLPPLFFNLEFGLVLANFEHYSLSSMVFGSGIRYRFGN